MEVTITAKDILAIVVVVGYFVVLLLRGEVPSFLEVVMAVILGFYFRDVTNTMLKRLGPGCGGGVYKPHESK
ncbi:MAG: hypothetical protein QW795_08455 [Candidatus Bathyarchaeia archaeon]